MSRPRLAKLLRLHSSHDPAQLTSLEGYVSRMKEDQKQIYFLSGEARSGACAARPSLWVQRGGVLWG